MPHGCVLLFRPDISRAPTAPLGAKSWANLSHARHPPFLPCRGAWSEVKVAGPKPRARCCTALFALEQRVLMFGGDTYGAQGFALPPPLPRRGSQAACCEAPNVTPSTSMLARLPSAIAAQMPPARRDSWKRWPLRGLEGDGSYHMQSAAC